MFIINCGNYFIIDQRIILKQKKKSLFYSYELHFNIYINEILVMLNYFLVEFILSELSLFLLYFFII